MSTVTEVDALADFKLTLDHFYSLVKSQVSNLQADQYIQLQAGAVQLDVDKEKYPWFSLSNLNHFFDVRLAPTPVSDSLVLLSGAKLSTEYILMLSDLLSLVEFKELDQLTIDKIEKLEAKVRNNGTRIGTLLTRRGEDWKIYASNSMIELGDLAKFHHWSQGHHTTRDIYALSQEQARDQSLVTALRIRKYNDPSDQAIVDAYAAATSPGERMRYPRHEDSLYGDEAKKFNAFYFGMLPDNDSNMFVNRQLITTKVSLGEIEATTIGALSETITKQSSANSTITTDWSSSANVSYGPFSMSASVSSHEKIKEDFKHTESITVGAKSIQAIKFEATWFRPGIYENKLIGKNRRLFEQYFGKDGSLAYYPTHLIVVRGLNLKFTSSQDWQYDYESDLSVGGSASIKIFGVGFGGGGNYSQSKRSQKIEKRGHDLLLDDGENIRIIGYVATRNTAFDVDAADFLNSMSDRFNI